MSTFQRLKFNQDGHFVCGNFMKWDLRCFGILRSVGGSFVPTFGENL